MKKRSKKATYLVGGAVLLLVVFLFVFRFVTLNNQFPKQEVIPKALGEPFALEDLNITVLNADLLDGKDVMEMYPLEGSSGEYYKEEAVKILMVNINIQYNGEDEEDALQQVGSFTTNCNVQSKDFANAFALEIMNAIDFGNLRKTLLSDQGAGITIPFPVPQSLFTEAQWNEINTRGFDLTVGCYPEKIIVSVL